MGAERGAQSQELGLGGVPGGHRVAGGVVVRLGPRRRETQGTGGEALVDEAAHRVDLCLAGRTPPVLAEHQPADSGVADQKAGVDRRVALDGVEIVVEGLPGDVHPGLERGERHALHPGE